MNISYLHETILSIKAKDQAVKIAGWVGNDSVRFYELAKQFMGDNRRVVQRAAWVIGLVANDHPELLCPQLDVLIQRMRQPGLPPAVKRSIMRRLQDIMLPEHLHGLIMNACFDWLADTREAVAIRVYPMTVLANLAKSYPELKQELRSLIVDGLEHGPKPAFKSRRLKMLKILN